MARVSTHGARQNKKPFPFLRLPHPVLVRVFSYKGVLPVQNLTICKALLPATLDALFAFARLVTPTQLRMFCLALARQPAFLRSVRGLRIGSAGKVYAGKGEENWDEAGEGSEGLARLFGDCESGQGDTLPVNSGLVKALVSRLPLLTDLKLSTVSLVAIFFDVDFLKHGPLPLPALRVLRLKICTHEGLNMPQAASLLHNLSEYLPSLHTLYLSRTIYSMPLDLLNLSPASRLPPRSWPLETFALCLVTLKPEIRNAFSAFSSLTRLVLRILERPYAKLMDDLARLPPTLRELVLNWGVSCPGKHQPDSLPRFGGSVQPYFPHLQQLLLAGDIVDASTFALLHTFPSLASLTLGVHTQIIADRLLALVDDVEALPLLDELVVDICACPPPSLKFPSSRQPLKRRPIWPREFGYSEAKRLIEAADEAGVELSGTVLCAARSCDKADGHDCPRWYR
ncbi:hypothetical protein JCM10213_008248 [Rhodosporidiobolus nylandii]